MVLIIAVSSFLSSSIFILLSTVEWAFRSVDALAETRQTIELFVIDQAYAAKLESTLLFLY